MKVSVIVPNFNHAPFLQQRIDSILNQTFQDFELILLDDASTDQSREILERYRDNPHVSHIVFNEVNSGSAFSQWNKGIELAHGEWVWVAESDDWAEPNFLETLLEKAGLSQDCMLAYAGTWWVDESGNRLWDTPDSEKVNVFQGPEFIRQRLAICNNIVNVSECIFRRDAYRSEEACRYEKMRLCGDWFFYVLLAEMGDVVEVKQPLSYYRQHGGNVSSDAERQGLTFIEGVDVLEYMIACCGLEKHDYARGWGRLWAKYERQYQFPSKVKQAVRQRMANYPEICFYHKLYQLKQWLK